MTTLCELIQASVARYPNNVLVHHRGRDRTYGEIWDQATAVAGWLRDRGLRRGQRVALLVPNSPEYVVCYFGILMAEGIVVALNPDTTPRELQHALVHCEPAVVMATAKCTNHLRAIAGKLPWVRATIQLEDGEPEPLAPGQSAVTLSNVLAHAPLDRPAENANASQAAQIIYTSGTTGSPKGVTLTHRNVVANCRSIVEYLRLQASDSIFVVLPFFYSYGNSLLLTHVAAGGRLVLASDFVFWSRALDLMEQQRATGFAGVPSTYAMLLHKTNFTERAFSDLRYLTCAGGGLAPATVERLRSAVPHAEIFPMYGQTEATARLSTLMPKDLDAKPGSIGKGIPGVELSVLDKHGHPVAVGEVGEIVARGENVMLGYWDDPRSTRRVLREGRLHTGDMARLDEDGYIYVVGRRSDIIKSNSYRIDPKEIEELIFEMEGIVDVAVVGRADEMLGEVAVAFVVPSSNGDRPSEQAVAEHANRNLPRYKHLRNVHMLDALPKTDSGKVKRAELRLLASSMAQG